MIPQTKPDFIIEGKKYWFERGRMTCETYSFDIFDTEAWDDEPIELYSQFKKRYENKYHFG